MNSYLPYSNAQDMKRQDTARIFIYQTGIVCPTADIPIPLSFLTRLHKYKPVFQVTTKSYIQEKYT